MGKLSKEAQRYRASRQKVYSAIERENERRSEAFGINMDEALIVKRSPGGNDRRWELDTR